MTKTVLIPVKLEEIKGWIFHHKDRPDDELDEPYTAYRRDHQDNKVGIIHRRTSFSF
jgi:hypothetical protein